MTLTYKGLPLLQQAFELGQQLGHPDTAEVKALLQKFSSGAPIK